MLKEGYRASVQRNHVRVLILILMEHAQKDGKSYRAKSLLWGVLILVLMEHAQRERSLYNYRDRT